MLCTTPTQVHSKKNDELLAGSQTHLPHQSVLPAWPSLKLIRKLPPTRSMETIVARGAISLSVCNALATHSVVTMVDTTRSGLRHFMFHRVVQITHGSQSSVQSFVGNVFAHHDPSALIEMQQARTSVSSHRDKFVTQVLRHLAKMLIKVSGCLFQVIHSFGHFPDTTRNRTPSGGTANTRFDGCVQTPCSHRKTLHSNCDGQPAQATFCRSVVQVSGLAPL